MPLLHTHGGTTCPVCGGDCTSFPQSPYSFPDQLPREATLDRKRGVPAPDRVFVDGRLRYPAGAIVPFDEAVALGLIASLPDPTPPPVKPAARRRRGETHAKRGPDETTAIALGEDR